MAAALAPAPVRPPVPAPALRLWPGVILVTLQWLAWLGVPLLLPDAASAGILAALAGGLLVMVWWLFFSRVPWPERGLALGTMIVAVLATGRLVHPSIASGMMGLLLVIQVTPLLSLALVAWAGVSRRLTRGGRRASLAVAIVLACGVMTLVRTGGITGGAASELHWRWSLTPEEKLLAEAAPSMPTPTLSTSPAPVHDSAGPAPVPGGSKAVAPDTVAGAPGAWTGFRGPQRDGVVHGSRIALDWASSAPRELWRRAVGPGWSSFAVEDGLVYTQEQRGEEERVTCYQLTSGTPVWSHGDPTRFWESNAGAGPRGTPTLAGGRVLTLGATGVLNALLATNGAVLWTRNAATDTGTKVPGWGFAGSPLVLGDRVVVATAGVVACYDLTTGTVRWIGEKGGWGYSSPQVATLEGTPQIVFLNGLGAVGIEPADGKTLWTYAWKSDGIVQPAVLADGEFLLGSGSGIGTGVGVHRFAVRRGPDGWVTEERWRSIGLKPYFSDFAVHQGHAYGFDGSMLACIDVADGKRRWKGGRYGHGQLLALAEQSVLVVLSETGDLALVKATPEEHVELARVPGVEGKTWNHPVLVGDVLLVRNDREMAAFSLAGSDTSPSGPIPTPK